MLLGGIFLNRVLWPVIFAVAACGIGAGEACAQAQGLAAVGPIDPANGYPQYFQDKSGLALEQCLDNTTPGDLCGVAVSDIPNPLAPVVFPDNFPSEFFYMLASARITIPPGAPLPPAGGGGKRRWWWWRRWRRRRHRRRQIDPYHGP
jgi:hypothetical protein